MIDVETFEVGRNRAPVRMAVFSGIARRRVLRQRRAIALVAGAGLLLVAGTAVGATKAVVRDPVYAGIATCYGYEDFSQPQSFGTSPEELDAMMPEVCSMFFQDGDIGLETKPEPDDNTDWPVPPGIAICLGPEGTPAGFPIWDVAETERDVCTRVGLPVLER
jgi:hypothetical protein